MLSDLSNLHTKTLLRFREVFNKNPAYHWDGGGMIYNCIQFDYGDNVILTTADAVKATLDTREHVPNKKEAKLKRQQKHGNH